MSSMKDQKSTKFRRPDKKVRNEDITITFKFSVNTAIPCIPMLIDHETDLQLLPPVKLNTITCESQNPRTHVEEPDYLNIHNTHRLERV